MTSHNGLVPDGNGLVLSGIKPLPGLIWTSSITNDIFMALCKTAVTALLMHWSYHSLAQGHQQNLTRRQNNVKHSRTFLYLHSENYSSGTPRSVSLMTSHNGLVPDGNGLVLSGIKPLPGLIWTSSITNDIFMALCKTAVTALLMHWSYHSLAQGHQQNLTRRQNNVKHSRTFLYLHPEIVS